MTYRVAFSLIGSSGRITKVVEAPDAEKAIERALGQMTNGQRRTVLVTERVEALDSLETKVIRR